MNWQYIKNFFSSKQFNVVSSTLTLRAIIAAIQFLFNITLGRLIGATGIGHYFLFVSWLNFTTIVGCGGLPSYILRHQPTLLTNKEYFLAWHFWKQAVFKSMFIVCIITLLYNLFSSQLSSFFLKDVNLAFFYKTLGWCAIPSVFLLISGAVLKSCKKPTLSIFYELGIVPISLLLLTIFFLLSNWKLSVTWIFLGNGIALCFAGSLSLIFIKSFFSSKLPSNIECNKELPKNLLIRSKRFWLIAILSHFYVHLPFFLMPYFCAQDQIGLFGVSNRLVSLATLILMALSSIYAPLFAEAYSQKNFLRLKQLLRQTQIYSILTYFPILIIFLFAGNWVLSLFGTEFTAAKSYLNILAIGHLINSASGLVSFFNIMTNSDKFELQLSILAIIILFSLIFSLGKMYGIIGITSAVSLTNCIKNLISLNKANSQIRHFINVNFH
jgi:O-antigen/teichoic acid export membrane protein